MKKMLLTLALLTALSAAALVPSMLFSPTSKDYNYNAMYYSTLVASTDEGVLAIMPGTRAAIANCALDGRYFLRLIDRQGAVVRELQLPGTEKAKALSLVNDIPILASYADGKVYIVFQPQKQVMRLVVDPVSMQVVESAPLVDDLLEPHSPLSIAWSPNHEYAALAVDTTHRLLLLDRKLDILWQRIATAGQTCMVDDLGNVYTCSSLVDNQGHTSLAMCMHQPDGQRLEENSTLTQPMAVQFLNASDGVVVAMGIVACNQQRKQDSYITFDRMAGIAFDFKSGTTKHSIEMFTHDELNIFGNLSLKHSNSEGRADCLNVTRTLASSFGGVAVVERLWMLTTRNLQTGMESTVYNTQGTLVMAVDWDGNILWHRPIRTRTKEGADGQLFSRPQLFEQGDEVCFLHVENKGAATYDLSKTAKVFNPALKHSQHGLYRINRQGEVRKTLLKQNGSTYGTPFRTGEGSWLLFQGLHQGGLATISFQ